MKRLLLLAVFLGLATAAWGYSQMPYTSGTSSRPSCVGFSPYPCARTDLSNPAFVVPNVGGLTGANTVYVDNFSGEVGVRVTDCNTISSCGTYQP